LRGSQAAKRGRFAYFALNNGSLLVPGCKGLQPSKSITAIKVLIGTLEGAGPSAARWTMKALFCRNTACAKIVGFIGSAAARDRSPPGQCRFSGRDGLRLRQGFFLRKGFGGQVGGHVRAVPNLISPKLRPYL